MNSLVKELIQPLLEAPNKLVALYPGKFKPPHRGHFEVAKQLLNQADEVVVVISPVPKDGITSQQSEAVWNLYKTLLGDKLSIVVSPSSPVSYVYDTIKENPEDNFLVAYGKGEESRYKSLVGNPKVKIIDGGTISDEGGNINATDFRNALQTSQDISRFLPANVDQQDFIKAIGAGTIEEDCGCQHEQPMNNLKDAMVSLTKYMIDNDMNILPLPKLKIINNDLENANNILGKTAHYDPNNCSITLYTLNRHPKDILRSYAHEMIHRIQDNEGRLHNISTTNTNEDGKLEELEKEAYLKGNMCFRNWEDSIKNV